MMRFSTDGYIEGVHEVLCRYRSTELGTPRYLFRLEDFERIGTFPPVEQILNVY